MKQPPAFFDLSAASFPFTIELWKPGADRRGKPTWTTTVRGPGALKVPGFGPGTWGRLTYPGNEVIILAPPGGDEADF